MLNRREFLAASLAAASTAQSRSELEPIVGPELFGAKGDGIGDDTSAFDALSARINAAGGGTIALAPGRTYRVGRQPGASSADRQSPEPIIALRNLARPLIIQGNGACLKTSAGLYYGSFDRAGKPARRPMPNLDRSLVASPYSAAISVSGCVAPITIFDVELDGNLPGLALGESWGGPGIQIPGTGLSLIDNGNEERIENVLIHHQPLDGAIISGLPERSARSCIDHLLCRYNGRQGLSLVGGRGYDFVDCEFAHTGRTRLATAPGAGVDLEAEEKVIRDVTFDRCKFLDNVGPGLVAESGDTADVRFNDCMFVGTSSWSAWPRKPSLVFERCSFAGAVVNAYASQIPGLATRFVGCSFTDDPRHSPDGKLFFGGGHAGPVVALGASDNVLFHDCRFILRRLGVLPWSWRAIYQNCEMLQVSKTPAMTKGKFIGRNVINGPVDLYGSMILGSVLLNGKAVPRGRVGSDFAPW